jgi:hypothetical protein
MRVMVAQLRRPEFVVIAALAAFGVSSWSKSVRTEEFPGNTWIPWFMLDSLMSNFGSDSLREVRAPFGILRILVLIVAVTIAVLWVAPRPGAGMRFGRRLAAGAGAGALGASLATAVSAPVVIPALVWAAPEPVEVPAADVFWFLQSSALQFGLVAGTLMAVAGSVFSRPRATAARRPTVAPSLSFASASRRASMVQSLGPRRGSGGLPPHTSGAAWAAPDVTRTLCAAVHVDPGLRRQTLRLLAGSRLRAVTPTPGVDLRPVLRHALAARRRDYERDLWRLFALVFLVIAVIGFRPIGVIPQVLLVLVVLAVAFAVEYRSHWKSECTIAALHDAQNTSDTPVPVPPAPPSEAERERLAAIDRAQQGRVTVSGLAAFAGIGTEVGKWELTLALRPAETPAVLGVSLSGTPRASATFTDSELSAAIREGLAAVDAAQRRRGLAGLQVAERVFVNGASLRDHELLLPEIGRPVRVLLPPEEFDAAEAAAPDAVRRYLVCRTTTWNGHVVTTTLLRVRSDGHFLQMECLRALETPLSSTYRALVSGGTGDRRPRTAFVLGGAAASFLPGLLLSPFLLLGRAAEALVEGNTERRETRQAYSERDFDYAGLGSVRTLGSAAHEMTYFQENDAVRYFQLTEKTILRAVMDFLEARGLDISELRNYQTMLLNQGVIQTGGVSLVGNQAVGVGAGVTGSQGTVRTGTGAAK